MHYFTNAFILVTQEEIDGIEARAYARGLSDGKRRRSPLKRSPQVSPSMTPALRKKITLLDRRGFAQHEIAAKLGINSGRVSEVLHP